MTKEKLWNKNFRIQFQKIWIFLSCSHSTELSVLERDYNLIRFKMILWIFKYLLKLDLSEDVVCFDTQQNDIETQEDALKHVTQHQGDQMFLVKNRPKTMKNHPKSHPTKFLLDLLYKTVLWCFLFDFMLISNGTGHSFIVFYIYIKKEIKFFENFW